MSKWIVVAALLWTGLSACGGDGGSGVAGNKSLVSLSEADLTKLCTYFNELAGPERTVTCTDGSSITIGGEEPIADCVASFKMDQTQHPSCTATVNDLEGCAEDFAKLSDAQLCMDVSLPASCLPLLSTACGGF